MMLIALLVFLVLRQVMPIASGLAGGASLSSLGIASRSISSGLASFRKNHADPARNKARPHVRDTLREVAGDAGEVIRGAVAEAPRVLGRSWRNWRR
jgi:hypothetical protein